MLDYYGILQIPTDASADLIKKAFRQKAKENHPDLWQQKPGAQDFMRDLIRAYETLMDLELREEYDLQHRKVYGTGGFDYREFLLSHPEDNESQSNFIFFDLLHHREKDALRLYEGLVKRRDFDLSKHLDREDFMDCAFILAEEFETEGQLESAYHLLRTIVHFEMQKPYFRHFFEEVVQRIRVLVGVKMIGKVPVHAHLEFVQTLIRFQISSKEMAYYFKVGAELYSKINDYPKAERYLKEALKLDKNLTGVKKLRQHLARRM